MPLLETIGSSGARGFGLFGKTEFNPSLLDSTGLIGYWDAGLALSAPTGSNGTTWKTLSASGTSYGGSMGDVNITGLNSDYAYGGSGSSAYVYNVNNTVRSGGSAGMAVSLSGFTRSVGTYEAWLYPTSYNASNGLFINRTDDTPNDGDWLWIGSWDSGNSFYLRSGRQPASTDCCSYDLNVGSTQINNGNGPANVWMPANAWKHIVVSWNHSIGSGNFSKVYVNGVEYWSINSSIITSNTRNSNPGGATTGRLFVGHNASNSQWMGRIGYVRMYNSALNSSQILNNFNVSKSRYI
jgi:Concanavalin A-like lectin/glucanases superfamily